jgi:hypothetical protein
LDRTISRQIARVETYLYSRPRQAAEKRPVLFFNASTRIHRVSLNAAYSLLASWILRARGQSVRYLICEHGMQQCILGARSAQPESDPPCRTCTRLSRMLFPEQLAVPLELEREAAADVLAEVEGSTIQEMMDWGRDGVPFGQLVLPSLRWVLRRHHLEDDATTRTLFRRFLASSASLRASFQHIIDQVQPRTVVVFNGIFFPEAIMRYVARECEIPTVTHEVGLRPFSAFFSHDEATFRQVSLDTGAKLDQDQEQALDRYLGNRFRGDFSMAGIRFWEAMRDPAMEVRQKLEQYDSYVPVFTNVIFDTSQIHANTLFADMFEWLEELKAIISKHEDVLFILRAHPDEDRPGKASQESVATWYANSGLVQRSNVAFIPPGEEVNSYTLIEGAKFVLVYNSSIGLEASILGKPVLCAGRARYTQADSVTFADTRQEYWKQLEAMLSSEALEVPERFRQNARRFLYEELYHASLDLSDFLQEDPTLPGMVTFKTFDPPALLDSLSLEVIYRGITSGVPFLSHQR